MTDSNQVLYEYLTTAGTALYTLVGARVYFGMLPQGYANTQAAIVLTRRGGETDRDAPELGHPSYSIACYGGSSRYGDAQAVFAALHDLIAGGTFSDTAKTNVCVEAQLSQGAGPLPDPDTGWPVVLCTLETTVA